MRLGDPNPLTVQIVTILISLAFMAFAGLFAVQAKQQWRRQPMQALQSLFIGVFILLFGGVCAFLMLS
jgi:hypothetical protein